MKSYKPLGSCRPVPYSTVCSRIGLYSRSSLILFRQPLGEPKLLWMGICILLILQTQSGKKYMYIHSYSTLSYLLTSLSFSPSPFFSPSTLSLYLHFILLSFFFPFVLSSFLFPLHSLFFSLSLSLFPLVIICSCGTIFSSVLGLMGVATLKILAEMKQDMPLL